MDCSRPDKAAIYPNDNIVALPPFEIQGIKQNHT